MDETIITAALTGVLATREQCPGIPYTPEEIAKEARRAVDAGAAILHIHARKDDGRPAYDVDTYQRIHAAVRELCPDVIINYSTGAVGLDREQRIHHVPAIKPDMAALNMGSMNYAIYSREKKKFYHDHVFANPFGDIAFYLKAMNEAGTRPEMECFDTGHIAASRPMIDMGILTPPYQFSLIMGVLGGIPATPQNLMHQVSQLPSESFWQVIGISRHQWTMVAAALTMGGNIRVGLEDNFYLPNKKMAESNGTLVEHAANLARMIGRKIATVERAREILSIKKLT